MEQFIHPTVFRCRSDCHAPKAVIPEMQTEAVACSWFMAIISWAVIDRIQSIPTCMGRIGILPVAENLGTVRPGIGTFIDPSCPPGRLFSPVKTSLKTKVWFQRAGT